MGDGSSTGESTLRRQASDGEKLTPKTAVEDLPSPRTSAVLPFQPRVSLDLDDYFTGPRDLSRHSKWPMFMRMHGSIMPKMVLPLLFVGGWATAVTVVSKKVHYLGTNSVLLTITGFVISLGLSFRSSTAYERYAEGRRYWSVLTQCSQALGRVFWIHATDPEGQDPRESMLRKLSCMNLVVAFSLSLKHMLRFEPFTTHSDMQHLISHLNTFASEATREQPDKALPPSKSFFKEAGEYLGVSFATSNPRKAFKKTDRELGNLPLEILNHIAIAIDEMITNGQLDIPMQQTLAYNNLHMMNDVLTGCERVLNTPLPLAYAIAISQITWVYVLLLPFQLIPLLEWVAIPATVAASYIILGLLLIGGEIENPFGRDVNDLPLEVFCEQIAHDMDVIASYDKRDPLGFMKHEDNKPLYPASMAPLGVWAQRDEDTVRDAIRNKPKKTFDLRRAFNLRKSGVPANHHPGDKMV
ncbi:hypothetical protein ACRE_068510 [Hapsidospora chrysogenum ATCC 11550]|uniref:Uncharacterized protein n=1 Tax=Hapsidospora chrysogenum (strain ATCC 11550 / CBS 779.69 / DSM 880 / IAM 14645 / JCM 23072 / IMI 49137) TaxID=857340 RepID=A0A086SZ80_HAPC1|nr:hypothetical protein ACRE_068510 [Hapsidospora chrysogenum ATCC 11550]